MWARVERPPTPRRVKNIIILIVALVAFTIAFVIGWRVATGVIQREKTRHYILTLELTCMAGNPPEAVRVVVYEPSGDVLANATLSAPFYTARVEFDTDSSLVFLWVDVPHGYYLINPQNVQTVYTPSNETIAVRLESSSMRIFIPVAEISKVSITCTYNSTVSHGYSGLAPVVFSIYMTKGMIVNFTMTASANASVSLEILSENLTTYMGDVILGSDVNITVIVLVSGVFNSTVEVVLRVEGLYVRAEGVGYVLVE